MSSCDLLSISEHKDRKTLVCEITSIVENTTDEEIKIIYKILKHFYKRILSNPNMLLVIPSHTVLSLVSVALLPYSSSSVWPCRQKRFHLFCLAAPGEKARTYVLVVSRPPSRCFGVTPFGRRTLCVSSLLLVTPNGVPGENRTHSLRFRKPALYPVELRGHLIAFFFLKDLRKKRNKKTEPFLKSSVFCVVID